MTDEKGNQFGLRVNVMSQVPDERGEHFRGKTFRRIRFDPSAPEGGVDLDDFFLVHVSRIEHPVGGGSGRGGGNGEADAEAAGRAQKKVLIAQHREKLKPLLMQEIAMLDELANMPIDDYTDRIDEMHVTKLRIFAELKQALKATM